MSELIGKEKKEVKEELLEYMKLYPVKEMTQLQKIIESERNRLSQKDFYNWFNGFLAALIGFNHIDNVTYSKLMKHYQVKYIENTNQSLKEAEEDFIKSYNDEYGK